MLEGGYKHGDIGQQDQQLDENDEHLHVGDLVWILPVKDNIRVFIHRRNSIVSPNESKMTL